MKFLEGNIVIKIVVEVKDDIEILWIDDFVFEELKILDLGICDIKGFMKMILIEIYFKESLI